MSSRALEWRRSAVVIGLVGCALLLVAWQTLRVTTAERAALFDRYALEQGRQVSEVARGLTEDLEAIRNDLRYTAQMIAGTADPRDDERPLSALIGAVPAYRVAAIHDQEGRSLALIGDPRTNIDPAPYAVVLRQTALAALAHLESDIQISPVPVGDTDSPLRVFAVAVPRAAGGPLALSLVVDTEPLLRRTRPLLSTADARLLILGRDGLPVVGSDTQLAAHVRRAPPASRFDELVEKMRRGEEGTERLPAAEAARLGVGGAALIAAYAPVSGFGRRRWSIAKLSSTGDLRRHELRVLWSFGLAALLIAGCLIALGGYFLALGRRTFLVREQLRHAQALAQLHERTRVLLDHVPSGVIALSADLRVTALNEALRHRAGEIALGVPLAEALPRAGVGQAARLEALLRDAMATGAVRSVLAERLDLFGQEGNYSIHAVSLGSAVADTRVMLVIEDLTEVTMLSTQLLHAEKLATVGILAAGIAHEIGTPLGVIRGRAEFLDEKLAAADFPRRDVGIIVEQADLVTRTIRQLLDFSRAKPTEVRAVSVSTVAQNVVELLRIEAERRKVALQAEIPSSLPPVAADRDQLQQVLVNLAMNACDACREGGRVALHASCDADDVVTIEVCDDGCGIPDENRHQVFDPFFTTKKRGQGTGLGLTIAAQIVRDHGGQIELDSEPARGTRVVVRLPTTRGREEGHGLAG